MADTEMKVIVQHIAEAQRQLSRAAKALSAANSLASQIPVYHELMKEIGHLGGIAAEIGKLRL